MQWRIVLLAIGMAVAAEGLAQDRAPLLVDRIVAVVNREVVTASELRERVELAERDLRRQSTPLPARELLERQVLERLILERVQLQQAAEAGVRVDGLQLDRSMERIAESNKMTVAQFRRALEADGVSIERFRDELRREIVMQRLREREVDDRLEVSETEIDLYLEDRKAGGGERAEYNIAHILLRLPDQASPERIEQTRARAAKILADARGGADFSALAASYSDAGDALQGGQMGWRPSDRLPELFTGALRTLAPGGVSEVLRSAAGFHILKLNERRGGDVDAVMKQTRLRHILVKTSEVVSEAEAQRRLTDLRERIVTGGADFAALARLHSADPSASRGGDLGWVFPGDTVPDFERAVDALKPGEVSQPVKTPFGWHLIEVLERRTDSLPAERQRLMARQALRERKSEEAFQEWLRQLRDRTYVELRLEDR